MKVSGKQPKFLPDVMQAIVDLREGSGSTQNKIVEHIQGIINSKKIVPRPRNVTMQVKRALKHGIQNGLLKQRAGKFQLGIHPKDFAVFKSFRNMGPLSGCYKCKKGRGRRGKRRRSKKRRRRRRALGPKDSFSMVETDTDFSRGGTPEPMDRGRRRRKGRKRRRRGRRRATGRISSGNSGTDQTQSPKSSKELIHSQRSQRRFESDNHKDLDIDKGDDSRCIQDDVRDSYIN